LQQQEWSPRDEHPQDVGGCLLAAGRLGCGMMSLQLVMFITMVLIGLLSFLFFR
jgi:hypothetical protein